MKITPIIMSRPMVIATRADRKSQTRRLNGLDDVNKFPDAWNHANLGALNYMAKRSARGKFGATFGSKPGAIEPETISICPAACPYGGPGDLLWVRESVWIYRATSAPSFIRPRYPADAPEGTRPLPMNNGDFIAQAPAKTTPSIHMPRALSRLTLELINVRVERLNDISEEDALAEGVVHDRAASYSRFHVPGVEHPAKDFPELSRTTAREMYAALWDCLHGSGEWLRNHWVWVLEFRVHQVNIDTLLKVREEAA